MTWRRVYGEMISLDPQRYVVPQIFGEKRSRAAYGCGSPKMAEAGRPSEVVSAGLGGPSITDCPAQCDDKNARILAYMAHQQSFDISGLAQTRADQISSAITSTSYGVPQPLFSPSITTACTGAASSPGVVGLASPRLAMTMPAQSTTPDPLASRLLHLSFARFAR